MVGWEPEQEYGHARGDSHHDKLAPQHRHGEELGEPEKEDLKFGFIKLTDMAPLAIAYEKGYFEDEGLYVTLEAQAN